MNWIFYTFVAIFSFGLQQFLYQVAAKRKCNTAWVTFLFMLTVTVLSVLALVFRGAIDISSTLLILATLNAVAYLGSTLTHIESLKCLDASIVGPIVRSGLAVIVVGGVLIFGEQLKLLHIIGLALAFSVILLLAKHDGPRHPHFFRGLAFAIVAMLLSATGSLIGKQVAITVDLLSFIAITYALQTTAAFILHKRLSSRPEKHEHRPPHLLLGIGMGICNLSGYLAILTALSSGPVSLVAALNSLFLIIVIILARVVYGEQLTAKRMAAIGLAIISGILLSL